MPLMRLTGRSDMIEREDALTMGVRLKAEAKAASEERIARAFDNMGTRYQASEIADFLNDAWWENRDDDEGFTASLVLDALCTRLFGCSFYELTVALDR